MPAHCGEAVTCWHVQNCRGLGGFPGCRDGRLPNCLHGVPSVHMQKIKDRKTELVPSDGAVDDSTTVIILSHPSFGVPLMPGALHTLLFSPATPQDAGMSYSLSRWPCWWVAVRVVTRADQLQTYSSSEAHTVKHPRLPLTGHLPSSPLFHPPLPPSFPRSAASSSHPVRVPALPKVIPGFTQPIWW